MARRNSPNDYAVGYSRPPIASRFKPGQSGNPRGRPKGAKNVDSILREALLRPVAVMEGGKRKQITVLEAFFKRLSKLALEGDPRSADRVIRLLPFLRQALDPDVPPIDPGAGNDSGPAGEGDRALLKYFADLVRDGDPDFSDEEVVQ